MSDAATLLTIAAIGVALVVALITWARVPAFLALALSSIFVGLATRMPLADIARSFQAGMGDTLGSIAMVIALGTVIGKLLAESGGAMVVAQALRRALGERRLDWALMLSGLIIGCQSSFKSDLSCWPRCCSPRSASLVCRSSAGSPDGRGTLGRAWPCASPSRPDRCDRAAGRRPGPDTFLFADSRPSALNYFGSDLLPVYLPSRRRRTRTDGGAVHQRRLPAVRQPSGSRSSPCSCRCC